MDDLGAGELRAARPDDAAQLLSLWELLYSDLQMLSEAPWQGHAGDWFARYVDDQLNARIPVVDVGAEIVATAIGTLEIGVPNPGCRTGRAARLANVITLPAHRRKGYGAMVVRDVIAWARTVQADRIELGATRDGQRLYEGLGFTSTSAPRMKFML